MRGTPYLQALAAVCGALLLAESGKSGSPEGTTVVAGELIILRAGDGHAGRGGFPDEFNLRRGYAVGLGNEGAEDALQVQGSGS